MPQLTFPYIRLGNTTLPIVPIQLIHLLQNNNSKISPTIYALIDSGADTSLFNSQILSLLSIPDITTTQQADPKPVTGIGGSIPIWTVRQNFRLSLLPSMAPGTFNWPITLKVAKNLTINLLGRDLLNRYRLTLDGWNGQIIVEF